jgi:hypothetical protein
MLELISGFFWAVKFSAAAPPLSLIFHLLYNPNFLGFWIIEEMQRNPFAS